jgi:hypothetical protein
MVEVSASLLSPSLSELTESVSSELLLSCSLRCPEDESRIDPAADLFSCHRFLPVRDHCVAAVVSEQ